MTQVLTSDPTAFQYIPVSLIEGQELRVGSSKNLDELTASLLLHGQLSPICVTPNESNPNTYQIVFGNRRLQAIKKLGWKKIKAEVLNVSKSDALVLAFSENSDREDFSDYEKALLLARIHETTGKQYKEVAGIVGRSSSYVSQHVAMLHLFSNEVGTSEERVRLLSSLTEGHARVLGRIEDPIERWNTAKLAVASGMGVRELARICSRKCEDSTVAKMREPETVPELIREIVKGTTGKDIRPFRNCICDKHFSMFSSFDNFRAMGLEEALDHVSSAVRKVDVWIQQIEELKIRTIHDVAYATMMINHQMKCSGHVLGARTRATLIFERENGDWKLAHGHWSAVDPEEQIRLLIEPEIQRK